MQHPKLTRFTIWCLIIIPSFYLKSQSLYPGSEQFIPPNPDVAAFVKYTESPVSLSSGSVQISVPLFELKSKKMKMPVSISYHGSGIRTKQEASNVGLGWNLNVGGVVTRTVQGMADESVLGYQNTFPLIMSGVDSTFVDAAQGGHDLTPDIYSFSFMGYSGKFCLNADEEVILLDDSEVKITRNFGPGSNSWEILTPTGDRFVFDETEEGFINLGGGSMTTAITAWHLTEVYSPNNILEFELEYSEQNTTFGNNYFSGTKFVVTANDCGIDQCGGGSGSTIYCCDDDGSFSLTIGTQNYKTLNRIRTSSNTYDLMFHYSSRSDLVGAMKLDSIQLVDKDDLKLYNQDFFYSYFGPNSQKLRLDSVARRSNSVVEPPYSFEYNNVSIDKSTGSFDHWGYPNMNDAEGIFPPDSYSDLEQLFAGDQCFGFPERDPDSLSVEGMLNKMNFPTGGFEQYEWENHQFGAIVDPDSLVSPQFITQDVTINTTSMDTVTSSVFTLSPEYPVIKYEMETMNSASCSGAGFGGCSAYFRIYQTEGNVIVFDQFVASDTNIITYVPLGEGSYYTEVIKDASSATHFVESTLTYHETDMSQAVLGLKAGGCRIKSISNNDGTRHFNYAKPDNYSSGILLYAPRYHFMQTSTKRCTGPADCTGAGCTGTLIYANNAISSLSGDHIYYTHITETLADSSYIDYVYDYEKDIQINSYPRTPYLSKHQLRGQLLNKNYYQVDGMNSTLIQSEKYVYSSFPLDGIPGYAIAISKNFTGCIDPVDVSVTAYNFKGHRKTLDSLITSLDGVITTKTYTYNDTFPTLIKKETMTNSNGVEYTTNYHYREDYEVGFMLDRLRDENRILPAWQTTKEADGVIIDGTKSLYGFADSTSISVPNGSNATNHFYPRDVYRYHYTWDENNVPDIDGWQLEFTNTAYDLRHGVVAKRKDRGWLDELEIYRDGNATIDSIIFADHKMSFEFNQSPLLYSSTAVDGQITNYSYDGLLRLDTISERNGNLKTAFAYAYQPNTVETKQIFTGLSDRITIQEYDSLGRVIKLTKKNYSETGQDVFSSTTYNERGQIKTQSDFENNITHFTYFKDPLNRQHTITDPMGFVMTYEYGTNDNEVVGYLDSLLFRQRIIDADGLISESYTDRKGRLLMARQSDGVDHADTYTEYDDKDRERIIIPPDATSSDTDLVFTYLYDGEDKLLRSKAPDQGFMDYIYDTRDLQIGMKDEKMTAQGKEWLLSLYDKYGRNTFVGFGTNLVFPIITETLITNSYDGNGTSNQSNPIYIGRMDKSVVNILDGYGKGTMDVTTEYGFDTYGRVSSEDINNPLIGDYDMAFTYDMSDNILTEACTTPIATVNYTNNFDNYGRLDATHVTTGGETQTVLSNIEYSNNDKVDKRHIRGGNEVIEYSYNANDWLTNIKVANTIYSRVDSCSLLSSNTDLFNFNIFYEQSNGAVTVPTRKNGSISSTSWDQAGYGEMVYGYEYDYLNRLVKATSNDNNAFGTEYAYKDKRGNIEMIKRYGYLLADSCYTTHMIDSLNFTYEANTNRLSQVADSDTLGDCPDYEKLPYTLDPGTYGVQKGLKSFGPVKRDISVLYTRKDTFASFLLDGGFSVNPDSLNGLYTFETKVADCPEYNMFESSRIPQAGFIERGTDPYEYDENGNLTYHDDKKLWIYYNYLNLPYRARNAVDTVHWYYTASGQKIRKLVQRDSSEQEKLYFGQIENDEGQAIVYHSEGQVRLDTINEWEYRLSDHLGNVRLLYSDKDNNDTLEILQNNNYYPFGMNMFGEWSYEGSNKNDFLYNGKEINRDLGLNWLDYGARSYDATIGRFTSVDPLAFERNWNTPYNFVQNNPVNRIDPNGMLDNPIYSENGDFLGTDDQGLQGQAIIMDEENFTQGMSHDDALKNSKGAEGLTSLEAGTKLLNHYNGLKDRPDYDGFVTIQEGIDWAKANQGALVNPTPDNMLYLDASKLDFGNISVGDFTNGVGKSSPINLLNSGNLVTSIGNETLRATVYALGRVDMNLLDKNGSVSIVNDFNKLAGRATDYDWNTGGSGLRNTLISAERSRAGLNDSHGFRTYYYGTGALKKPFTPQFPTGPKY